MTSIVMGQAAHETEELGNLHLHVECSFNFYIESVNIFGKLVLHIDLRQFSYRTFLSRKAWINRPISGASSSSAKCPVSSRCNSVFGTSRRNASAPGAEKIGSFLPHTASTGGCLSRRY